jgi:hypothetical protein
MAAHRQRLMADCKKLIADTEYPTAVSMVSALKKPRDRISLEMLEERL